MMLVLACKKKVQTIKAGIAILNISKFLRNIVLKGEIVKNQDSIDNTIDIKSGIKASIKAYYGEGTNDRVSKDKDEK